MEEANIKQHSVHFSDAITYGERRSTSAACRLPSCRCVFECAEKSSSSQHKCVFKFISLSLWQPDGAARRTHEPEVQPESASQQEDVSQRITVSLAPRLAVRLAAKC